MEILIFGGVVWAIVAAIRASIRKQEAADAAAAEVHRRELAVLEAQHWQESLRGTINGVSRFGLALAREVSQEIPNWPAVWELIDTLPDWPIHRSFRQTTDCAEQLRHRIELSRAAGVPGQACDTVLEAARRQEYALWSVLNRVSLVGQDHADDPRWRRLDREVRWYVEQDDREVRQIGGRMSKAGETLSRAIAQGNRRDRRYERDAAIELAAAAEAVRILTQSDHL